MKIARIIVLLVLFGCVSCLPKEQLDEQSYQSYIDYCKTDYFCYQALMSPNGEYLVSYNQPYAVFEDAHSFSVKRIDEISILRADNDEPIIIHFDVGFEVIHGRPYWSPKSDAFYIYGEKELLLISINGAGDKYTLAQFPYDEERLYLGVGNLSKSIYVSAFRINETCIPNTGMCDDYELIWMPDGSLLSPRKDGLDYDIYHENGQIESVKLTVTVESADSIASEYITTNDGTSFFWIMVNYSEIVSNYRVFERFCLVATDYTDFSEVRTLFCRDGDNVLSINHVFEASGNLYAFITYQNRDVDLFLVNSELQETTLIKHYLADEAKGFGENDKPLTQKVEDGVMMAPFGNGEIDILHPSTNQITSFEIPPFEKGVSSFTIYEPMNLIIFNNAMNEPANICEIQTANCVYVKEKISLPNPDVLIIGAGWDEEIAKMALLVIDEANATTTVALLDLTTLFVEK